jgi:hypothetical protein
MNELRRLKYRFVLIVMAMLFTITSAVLAGIYFTMTRAETQLAVRMMTEMAERDGGAPRDPRPDDNDFDPKPVPENRTPLDDVTRRFSGFEMAARQSLPCSATASPSGWMPKATFSRSTARVDSFSAPVPRMQWTRCRKKNRQISPRPSPSF